MHSHVSIFDVFFVALFTLLGIQAVSPRWNDLKATYTSPTSLPRTKADALSKGYTQSGAGCSPHPSFRGFQFAKNNDSTLQLLYDVNGYIAGIQMAVPKNLRDGYPVVDGTDTGFVNRGDRYAVTVYFVDPAIICRRGRSIQQFRAQGTASGLYIQYGDDPETDVFEAPYMVNESRWTEGLCFPGMGRHYYKTATKDMSCDHLYPIGLLYYDGVLTGFIFMFSARINSSTGVLEYPPSESFKYIIRDVPTCFLAADFAGTSLHVFLEGDPSIFTCQPVTATTTASPGDGKCTSGSDKVQMGALLLATWTAVVKYVFIFN